MTDPTGDPVILQVTGGAAGIAASYAAARALADGFDAAGDRMREWGAAGLRVLKDPDLLESGLLSPGTCALAEMAVLAATGGPRGVLAASIGWELDAVAVRCAIGLLEAVDLTVRASFATLDRQLVTVELAALATTTALGGEDALTEHPGLLSHTVSGLGGPVGALGLSALYGGPGRPHVAAYPTDLPAGRTQPASVRDLIEHLHDVAALSGHPDSPANGTIAVQTITGPAGVRHVVYLPGTDDFNAPWDQDDDVRDLETDLDLMGRRPDAYQAGVIAALHEAGVRPDEPVLVVGHSLGGMAAAALLAGPSGFHVTDVVTAGSPTAQVPGFPAGSHVLSLEQEGDVVPQLDGTANPDSVEQTTVVFDAHPGPGVVPHHGYTAYEQGGALVDQSTDPSVTASVQSLHDHGFLGAGGDQVSTQVFQITR